KKKKYDKTCVIRVICVQKNKTKNLRHPPHLRPKKTKLRSKKMKETEIQLMLTLEEIEIIFKALGDQPFKTVFELIGKINEQVVEQTTEK
ncbi:MAG: hypothetical protein RLZZ292_98, partial [Bacteroidota bacterium]